MQKDIVDRRGFAKYFGLCTVDDEQRAAVVFVAKFDVDHALGVFVGVRIEENAVDDAEDGGGGANAEHQGEDGADSKAGRFEELPKRETQILHQGSHGPTSAARYTC